MIPLTRRTLVGALAALPFVHAAAAATPGSKDALVCAWTTEHAFNGVILVAERGRVTYAAPFGNANFDPPTPITLATRFGIGSISKLLTTAAVLRLIDAHRLSLDTRLATLLPSFENDPAGVVPVLALLSNRSGIPDRLSIAAKADPALRTLDAPALTMAERYARGPLAAPTGTAFDYTVLNWVIVRAIIEAVAKRPFSAALESLVLRPLGLSETGIAEAGFDRVAGIATAYRSITPPVQAMSKVPAYAAASGTFYATAADLAKAVRGIVSPRFLKARAREALLTVHTADESYALGGRVRTIDGQRWAWETGQTGGYRAHAAHAIDEDRTVVVLNNSSVAQSEIGALVERLIAGADRA